MTSQELDKAYTKRELAEKTFNEALEIYIKARLDYDKALQTYLSDSPEAFVPEK